MSIDRFLASAPRPRGRLLAVDPDLERVVAAVLDAVLDVADEDGEAMVPGASIIKVQDGAAGG